MVNKASYRPSKVRQSHAYIKMTNLLMFHQDGGGPLHRGDTKECFF